MGINVCVQVKNATSSIVGDMMNVEFAGKVTMFIVDEMTRQVNEVTFVLGGIDQYMRAFELIGKIGYANVEEVDGEPLVFFLDKTPFEDEVWREEKLMAYLEGAGQ